MRRDNCPHSSTAAMHTPLSEPVFQIMLALSGRPLHGLGVAAEVEERTDGRVVLGVSTLYTVLARMREDGWIEEVDAPLGEADPRRRFYALTGVGQRVLRADVGRLEVMVRDARAKSILPYEGPA